MPDQPGRGKDRRRPGERLPRRIPADIRDFVLCKTGKLELRGGKLDWLKIEFGGFSVDGPEVSFQQNADGSVTATMSAAGGFVSTSVTASVGPNGELQVTPQGALGAAAKGPIDDWVRDFNEDLKQNGKKIEGIKVEQGVLVITKLGVATPGRAGPGGPRRRGRRARVAAALVGVGAIGVGVAVAVGSGDQGDKRPSSASGNASTSSSGPRPLGVAASEYHDEAVGRSYVKICFTRGFKPGPYEVRVVKPTGEAVFQRVDAQRAEQPILVEVTGTGPGTYRVQVTDAQTRQAEFASAQFGASQGTPTCPASG